MRVAVGVVVLVLLLLAAASALFYIYLTLHVYHTKQMGKPRLYTRNMYQINPLMCVILYTKDFNIIH